jgi:uncharacterized damage-inducible protein DinB
LEAGEVLIMENIELLDQAEALIGQMSDRLYSNNENLRPFQSGVGMHIRHLLDFYKAFLAMRDGTIDYDRRERSLALETDREAALEAIRSVGKALRGVDDIDRRVLSKNDDGGRRDPQTAFNHSSIGRELQFLASHTVHHYAIIAMILAFQGFTPPKDFGVAASTLSYRRGAALADHF